MAGITFSEIMFADGTTLNLSPGDILVLTEPNSGGKSNALRTLSRRLTRFNNAQAQDTIQSTKTARSGNLEEFISQLKRRGSLTRESNGHWRFIGNRIGSWPIPPDAWEQDLHEVFNEFFSTLLTARQRFNIVDSTNVTKYQDAESPLQKLQFDEPVEREIGDLTRKSFGLEIYTHLDGGTLQLKVGKRRNFPTRNDYRTPTEQAKAQALSNLTDEGDGIQSFVAVAMAALVEPKSVILIDEAEAFLHPPQAKRLAEGLVFKVPKSSQLVIATHNYDFLRALVSSGGERVHVVRIRRNPHTVTKLLPNQQLKEMWKDPLIFTSDAISALFHDVAVLCEGETDARFLRAMTDALEDQYGEGIPDIRFFSCGSKAKIDKIAKSMASIGVPTIAVTDCDLLNQKALIERILDSLRATVQNFAVDYAKVAMALNAATKKRTAASVLGELEAQVELIKKLDAEQRMQPLPKSRRKAICDVLADNGQWSALKKIGRRALIPLGQDVVDAFDRIRQQGAAAGLLINIHGEQEAFWPEGPRNSKQEWLEAALRKDLISDPDLELARAFTREIIETAIQLRGGWTTRPGWPLPARAFLS